MKHFLLAILSLVVLSGSAQTVDDVIKPYAAKMGKPEAFNKITTIKTTGTFSTQGNDLASTMQVINGRAVRTDIEAAGMQIVNAYIDGKGWRINPFGGSSDPVEVTDEAELFELKMQSLLMPVLMDYKARGYTAALGASETVDGIKTNQVILTAKSGKVTSYFISISDSTLIKSVTERMMQGQSTKVETYYSDLKEYNGVKLFHTRTSKINGETFQTATIDKVEFDVVIDEKQFVMPK